MSFLTPLALIGGLLAVPIVLLYMLRLRRDDFADAGEIARYAAVTRLSPEDFRKQFEYLVNAEAPPLALGH